MGDLDPVGGHHRLTRSGEIGADRPHPGIRGLRTQIRTVDETGMDVADRLRAEAARGATGRLEIDTAGVSGRVWLRAGRVSSVATSSGRPALGMRLVSGGSLSLTKLGEALQAQRQHPDMRLGDVLVRMGFTSRQEVEAMAWEQTCDDVAAMLSWSQPTMTFTELRPDEVAPGGPEVEDVLSAAVDRSVTWRNVVRQVGGPDTVPVLCEAADTTETALGPTDWAVLCRVDGRRSLRSICDQAGLSAVEAAAVLQSLIAAGLVSVPNPVLPPPEPAPAQSIVETPQTQTETFDDPADLLRELSQLSGTQRPARRASR